MKKSHLLTVGLLASFAVLTGCLKGCKDHRTDEAKKEEKAEKVLKNDINTVLKEGHDKDKADAEAKDELLVNEGESEEGNV